MSEREECIEIFKKLNKKVSDSYNEPVYHYTSLKGFKGIIENNELWLTNSDFLNDRTECKELKNNADSVKPKSTDWDEDTEFVWNITTSKESKSSLYLASFCKEPDSLSQWRAYGDYCIGFNIDQLSKNGFRTFKCLYSQDDIKNWMEDRLSLNEWQFDLFKKGEFKQYKRAAFVSLFNNAIMKYKNKSFSEESEIRLTTISNYTWEPYQNSPGMYGDDPPIHFRDHVSFHFPIPYVKYIDFETDTDNYRSIEIQNETEDQMRERKRKSEQQAKRKSLPIESILIGPMPNQKEAEIAVKIFLHENGYNNVKVKLSEIPFR
jgi:hypothetical protein